ncbi:hypothetical protein B0H13DRAFT_1861783 [Mycena leptocephala]|nr:hypothetical protein B0H13DRAFT_1861783 [Mycena leptocephala]
MPVFIQEPLITGRALAVWTYLNHKFVALSLWRRFIVSALKESRRTEKIARPSSYVLKAKRAHALQYPRQRQGGVEIENENITEHIRASQPKSGRRGGRHDKREDGRTLQPWGPKERDACRDGDVDRRTKVGVSTSPSGKEAVEAR